MINSTRSAIIIGYSLLVRLLSGVSLGIWSVGAFITPGIGFFANAPTCIGLYILRTVAMLAVSGQPLHLMLHLPSLAGSLVLSVDSKLLRVGIPLICLMTFLFHPIGFESWVYTLYWLIPIGIAFKSQPSIFLKSISSTLTTHAVGSTIYLYTHSTSSLFWHTLVPQVALERLTAALLLTLSYYLVSSCIELLSLQRTEGRLCQNRLPSF